MFYFDKNNPHVLFCDCRHDTFKLSDGRVFDVCPDIVSDVTELPFLDESFYHVVFDPPHLTSCTQKSDMFFHYSKLKKGWEQFIHKGFAECWRVLKQGGTLVFKWNEHDISIKRVIEAIGREPLYGNKNLKGKTHWLCFVKV
jgi:tRNA G10  N-methylase Trm11